VSSTTLKTRRGPESSTYGHSIPQERGVPFLLPGVPLDACAGWLLGRSRGPHVLTAKPRWLPWGDLQEYGRPDRVDPLTKEELVSLEWVSAATPRVVIPAAHIDNLLATGCVQESLSGLALTDLGVWRLDREQAKQLT
jgi:hypothetical protein